MWKDMRYLGTKVTADQVAEAFAVWDCTKGYTHLAAKLMDVLDFWEVRYQRGDVFRIADGMLQRARKAGIIRHVGGGKWEWTI